MKCFNEWVKAEPKHLDREETAEYISWYLIQLKQMLLYYYVNWTILLDAEVEDAKGKLTCKKRKHTHRDMGSIFSVADFL